MATEEHVRHVETIIGHTFTSKFLILLALTAAGADKENYDGNRKLSQLGASLVDTLLAIIVYGTGVNRECTANLRKDFIKKEHYSIVAKQTGIDKCIKKNERTESESPEVHRKAINAVIAAVFLDTWDVRSTMRVTLRPNLESESDLSWCLNEEFFSSDGSLVPSNSIKSLNPDSPVSTGGPSTRGSLAALTHDSSQFLNASSGGGENNQPAAIRGSQIAKRRRTSASCSVNEFQAQKRTKTTAQGLLPLQPTYFRQRIQDQLLGVKNELLVMLAITIASPQQIVALREILRNERAGKSLQSCFLRGGISRRERVGIILELDRRLSVTQLTRWYHIIDLFEGCGGPKTRSITGYVVTTTADFQSQKQAFGNPSHKDDANVAQAMMKDIFPDAQPGTEEYKKKSNAIKRIRKLGQRLHILVERFGRGVLGLMLGLDRGDSANMTIPDQVPNDTAFAEFVRLLSLSQGELLRKFSKAILPPLIALLHGALGDTEPFPLENVDPQQILSLPKGSTSLLRLIS
ncbi:uncharacterized protein BDW43DRAFT_311974 [Aspergillus alliaceus]|uniref:uncharacterized protein n=1 Tax=Petromyces alliaceus TaxID=209559 RepID=UPI0012A4E517|nr:uncharacterized protein BDW43DRAFT_311974 [Aspergillus alliaceus]KAB8232589.1 hypothetical protein BDW43DRAFT_311974 [Aspergillus alliaceus]